MIPDIPKFRNLVVYAPLFILWDSFLINRIHHRVLWNDYFTCLSLTFKYLKITLLFEKILSKIWILNGTAMEMWQLEVAVCVQFGKSMYIQLKAPPEEEVSSYCHFGSPSSPLPWDFKMGQTYSERRWCDLKLQWK